MKNMNKYSRLWHANYSFFATIILITAGYYGFSYIWKKIEIVVSPSVKYRVFLKNIGELRKNTYVRFTIENTLLPKGATTITKRLSCMSGETLETRGRSHYCNGTYLDTSKRTSIAGEPLPLFYFNDIIPEGFAYVSGYHHDSFDSRYWGFLELSREDIIPMKPLI